MTDGLLINIAIPNVSRIKEVQDLAHLEDLLHSAIVQSAALSRYIMALEARVRELRSGSVKVRYG